MGFLGGTVSERNPKKTLRYTNINGVLEERTSIICCSTVKHSINTYTMKIYGRIGRGYREDVNWRCNNPKLTHLWYESPGSTGIPVETVTKEYLSRTPLTFLLKSNFYPPTKRPRPCPVIWVSHHPISDVAPNCNTFTQPLVEYGVGVETWHTVTTNGTTIEAQ